MKIKAPLYYKKFRCIAEKCRHSCCVGWKIEIDAATKEKYNSLCGKTAEKLKKHIKNDEDSNYIEMCENGRCPFLTDFGLCELITNFGDEYLSDICREHPRFYNYTNEGIEVGLGMVCEEAARIILSSDDFEIDDCIGNDDFDVEIREFNPLPVRNELLTLLKNKELSYRDKTEYIKKIYGAEAWMLGESELCELLSELEYLSDKNKKLFSDISYSHNVRSEEKLTRFLAYMIFRHLTVADSILNLSARLCFCLLSAEIVNALTIDESADIEEIARIYSEEIEYSEENSEALIFDLECRLQ